MNSYVKPPIGASPWWFYPKVRIKELSEAMTRYSDVQNFDDEYAKCIKFWAQEAIMWCDNYVELHKKYLETTK